MSLLKITLLYLSLQNAINYQSTVASVNNLSSHAKQFVRICTDNKVVLLKIIATTEQTVDKSEQNMQKVMNDVLDMHIKI